MTNLKLFKLLSLLIVLSVVLSPVLVSPATAARGDAGESLDSGYYNAPKASNTLPENKSFIKRKKMVNSDSIGWLSVPGTTIDEVVVFNPRYRNNFYGNRDFQGNPSKNGTTYVDYRCNFGAGARKELARNTVIYGHSWTDNPNGILFAQLKKYKDVDFAKEHPYIFFSTEKEDIAWEVFAVLDAHVNFPYILSNPSSGYTVPQLLKSIRKSSIYDYNVEVSSKDKVLTLSTCTFNVDGHSNLPEINNYRFVVVAKMVPASETLKLKAKFSVNPSPHPPDTYNFIP